MMTPGLAWLIFFLPLASFGIIALFLRPFKASHRLSGYVTIAAIGGAFLLALWTLRTILGSPGHVIATKPVDWLKIGGLTVQMGLTLDALTGVMLIVVTSVSLMVQIYSQGYMHGDEGYPRYYAFMSLFTASMLGLVLADNLVMIYVFWELVGLCSYLLIGFWFHRPAAASAAKKAFIVTRLGDFGFLAAILTAYASTGNLSFQALFAPGSLETLAKGSFLGVSVITWVSLGIFSGAVGKSAQFPLHVWLPDAMEGPTPVSALIHAATMVAAGVYLVARTFPIFEHLGLGGPGLTTVAIIGGFTAIFAASMGLVANDIKRVLAYSTVSQLGYMMLALGSGSVAVALFHLMNHAFFKALLFLGAGSVNHASGTFDMREMGGLRRYMPWTFGTFLVASLSLAGIWPLAGFWSKDEVLAVALDHRPILFVLAMITVFLTALYVFRAVFLTFGGEYRGQTKGEYHEHAHGHAPAHEVHLHESPAVMVAPMALLGVMAVISGWLNVTGRFGAFLGEHEETHGFFGILAQPLALVSLAVAALGILTAYAFYGARWLSAEKMGQMFSPVYRVLFRKYYFDELYERAIVVRFAVDGVFRVLQWLDTYIVDGLVNLTAWLTMTLGGVLRRLQNGQVQAYGLAIFFGVVVIMAVFYVTR